MLESNVYVVRTNARFGSIMYPAKELLQSLTDPNNSLNEKRALVDDFSYQFGWRPNDFLDVPAALPAANLVVEHGLDNAAMLSFLPSTRELHDVGLDERRSILGLSYNSLIDWHVLIDQRFIECIYNRSNPPKIIYNHRFDETDFTALKKETFEKAIGLTPNPKVLPLDVALLNTISFWKRLLSVELGGAVTATSISALFNAIILARAVEDFHSKNNVSNNTLGLKDILDGTDLGIVDAIQQSIQVNTGASVPSELFNRMMLDPFANLSTNNQKQLVNAFYRHQNVPYDYDFSVMSKFALSKIYERYVAVMTHEEAVQIPMFQSSQEQTSFLNQEEVWNKALGGIYTPQYIANFFAKYLKLNMSTERFIDARIADPACGSGIFLRGAMEQKILADSADVPEATDRALGSLFGIDINEDAATAAKLSLSLLHLAGRGRLPDHVPIICEESLNWFATRSDSLEIGFDAIMMNPPFVRTELQTPEIRSLISEGLEGIAKGKLDTYSAFVVSAIKALRPGGYGCFVVPETLLTSENLKSLRNWIREQCWVRVIADLSAIRVFHAGVYVVLLIVQRKIPATLHEPSISIVRCRQDVGLALDDLLNRVHRDIASYLIFDTRQSALERGSWAVIAPDQMSLMEKLESLPRLGDIATVRQGSISGADKVFIVGVDDVPDGEEDLYRPYLPDRLITRFALPGETGLRMFYPYMDDKLVNAGQLEAEFPETWARLNSFRNELASRRSIANSGLEWWQPTRPRPPHVMLAPKLVTPGVALFSRFGVDFNGQWIVSHSPIIQLNDRYSDQEMLLLLAGVLNSSVMNWFIDLNASKYGNGYNRINVALLKRVPIPYFDLVPKPRIQMLITLISELLSNSDFFDYNLTMQVDHAIMKYLFELSDDEISLFVPTNSAD